RGVGAEGPAPRPGHRRAEDPAARVIHAPGAEGDELPADGARVTRDGERGDRGPIPEEEAIRSAGHGRPKAHPSVIRHAEQTELLERPAAGGPMSATTRPPGPRSPAASTCRSVPAWTWKRTAEPPRKATRPASSSAGSEKRENGRPSADGAPAATMVAARPALAVAAD